MGPGPGADFGVNQEIHLPTGHDAMHAILTVTAREGAAGCVRAPGLTRVVVLPELRIRLRLMPGTGLRFLKQVFPARLDLTHRCRALDERTIEFSTGSWGGRESRDYQLCLDVDPNGRPRGEDLQVAVVELAAVVAGSTEAQRCGAPAPIIVHWTDGPARSSRPPEDPGRSPGPDRTCALCRRVSPGDARYCGGCGDVLIEPDEA